MTALELQATGHRFSVAVYDSTQHANRKRGTRARVLSTTLAHGDSKNEEDKVTAEEGKNREESMERSTSGSKGKEAPTVHHIHLISKGYTILHKRKSTVKLN